MSCRSIINAYYLLRDPLLLLRRDQRNYFKGIRESQPCRKSRHVCKKNSHLKMCPHADVCNYAIIEGVRKKNNSVAYVQSVQKHFG